MGDTEVVPGSETYTARQDLSQDKHLDGMPFGTVGGMQARHVFPVDGDYVLQATLYRTNVDQTRGLEHEHQLEIAVDGERVFLETIGGTPPGNPGGDDEAATGRGRLLSRSDAIDARLQVRVPVKAGPARRDRRVPAALARRRIRASCSRIAVRSTPTTRRACPHIETLVVKGPFTVDAPGETPSRARDLHVPPGHTGAARSRARARSSSSLVRRAYRQPASPSDVTRAMEFYRAGRKDGTLRVRHPARAAAHSRQPEVRACASSAILTDVPDGAAYRISDVELASRLSFFLWSSIPDDELLTLAERGQAARARGARAAGAPHARATRVPARSWTTSPASGCSCATCSDVTPDNDLFPEFDDNLRQAFRREVELLFDSIMREDRSVLDLLTADYTFVNERLAQALRHSERLRQPVPARAGDRRGAQGAARQGQRCCW